MVAERKRESYSGEAMGRHDEAEAERLVRAGMRALGLTEADLAKQAKGSRDKCLLAWLAQEGTLAKQNWLVDRLKMGAASGIGAYAKRVREATDSETRRLRKALQDCK